MHKCNQYMQSSTRNPVHAIQSTQSGTHGQLLEARAARHRRGGAKGCGMRNAGRHMIQVAQNGLVGKAARSCAGRPDAWGTCAQFMANTNAR